MKKSKAHLAGVVAAGVAWLMILWTIMWLIGCFLTWSWEPYWPHSFWTRVLFLGVFFVVGKETAKLYRKERDGIPWNPNRYK